MRAGDYQNKSLARSLPCFRTDLRRNRNQGLVTHEQLYQSKKVTLIDALDRVIDKGAYVDGELVLRVADIDLVFVGLRLMVTSISNAERLSGRRMGKPASSAADDQTCVKRLEKQLAEIEASIPKIIDANEPENAGKGIAKLVLTLVELIRQLLEREAVRRVDTGTLSESEIQKLGLTFKTIEQKIQQLKAVFGIKEDLNLNLGPLGDLL